MVILQANSNNQSKFSSKYLFLFLPACTQLFLEVISCSISQNRNNQLFIYIFKIGLWFIFTKILPIVMTIIVLYVCEERLILISKNISEFDNLNAKIHWRRVLIIFGFICLILVLGTMLVFFNIPLFPTIEYLLIICAFILGFAFYFKPDFLKFHD